MIALYCFLAFQWQLWNIRWGEKSIIIIKQYRWCTNRSYRQLYLNWVASWHIILWLTFTPRAQENHVRVSRVLLEEIPNQAQSRFQFTVNSNMLPWIQRSGKDYIYDWVTLKSHLKVTYYNVFILQVRVSTGYLCLHVSTFLTRKVPSLHPSGFSC